jgi:hypothetical protein
MKKKEEKKCYLQVIELDRGICINLWGPGIAGKSASQ